MFHGYMQGIDHERMDCLALKRSDFGNCGVFKAPESWVEVVAGTAFSKR